MESMTTFKDSILNKAYELGLKEPTIYEYCDDGVFAADLTHRENGMEVLYVGVSWEEFKSAQEALKELDNILRDETRQGGT